MKFSRENKSSELIEKFDHSLEGSVYSGLIGSVLEINDRFTFDNEYFYDTDDEKLIAAADFIYSCGTPRLINILSSMEGKLGIVYANGIEKLLDELLKLDQSRLPSDLLEDIPTNFSNSINFGVGSLLYRLAKGIAVNLGAGKAYKYATHSSAYRGAIRKSAIGRDVEAIKKGVKLREAREVRSLNRQKQIEKDLEFFEKNHSSQDIARSKSLLEEERKHYLDLIEATNKAKANMNSAIEAIDTRTIGTKVSDSLKGGAKLLINKNPLVGGILTDVSTVKGATKWSIYDEAFDTAIKESKNVIKKIKKAKEAKKLTQTAKEMEKKDV